MKFSLNPETVSALHLTRTFPVPKDKVQKAWADAAQLAKWWAPEGLTLNASAWKPKVGEEFHFDFQGPGGESVRVVGEFRDASSDMWVFTWAREGKNQNTGGTLVTVEFRKVPKGCELALTHEMLPSAESREQQRGEWLARLERLSRALA